MAVQSDSLMEMHLSLGEGTPRPAKLETFLDGRLICCEFSSCLMKPFQPEDGPDRCICRGGIRKVVCVVYQDRARIK